MTAYCSLRRIVIAIGLMTVLASIVVCVAPAAAAGERPPQVSTIDQGARIDDVSIETYGVTNPEIVKRYLSLHAGDVLGQDAVQRDYTNLLTLAGLRARLEVVRHPESGGVSLRWIVLGKWFATTDHPFYGDQPLTIPIEGFGWVFTSRPLDGSGATVSSYSQVALRAQLARIVYTKPLWVDSKSGREGDLIVNTLGARGVFRASEPVTEDVYSWATGYEALYLVQGTNGTQIEFGFRETRSTSAKPTYITAPSLYDTFYRPARSSTFEAGISHRCAGPPTQWYPPHCYLQYRVEAFDLIGGLGATSESRTLIADTAQYNRVGASTLVFHGALERTGGVLPASGLLCAYTFGYAKATCGTDADLLQAEFRIATGGPVRSSSFSLPRRRPAASGEAINPLPRRVSFGGPTPASVCCITAFASTSRTAARAAELRTRCSASFFRRTKHSLGFGSKRPGFEPADDLWYVASIGHRSP